MGKLSLTLIVVGTAACGSNNNNTVDAHVIVPDTKPIDAPKVFNDAPPVNYDFTCMGNAAPAAGSAAASITASGIVTQIDLQGTTPVITMPDGATLNACKSGAADCTATGNHYGAQTMSAGGGLFSIGPFDTATNPVDLYVSMALTGDRPGRIYPAGPLVADQPNIPVLTFTNSAFTSLATFTGQMAANGTIGLLVADCANTPIADASNVTLSIKQGGTAVANTNTVDLSTLSPMAAGAYLVFNVPPGETEVGATYKSMVLRPHVVSVVQATDSETIVRPGY